MSEQSRMQELVQGIHLSSKQHRAQQPLDLEPGVMLARLGHSPLAIQGDGFMGVAAHADIVTNGIAEVF